MVGQVTLLQNHKKTQRNTHNRQNDRPTVEQPLAIDDLKQQLRECFESILQFCLSGDNDSLFFSFEKKLQDKIFLLGALYCQLYLISRHERFCYSNWLKGDRYYAQRNLSGRTICTIFGEVRYWRRYFIHKGNSSGFFPFDTAVGLSKDGFSPLVMKLAAKLATRVSFGTCILLLRSFYGWSPSKESIQDMVLGIGREASCYMETANFTEDEGEVLVIEVDGKAIATLTDRELAKRKKSRKRQKVSCCRRHRGKACRKQTKRVRRKADDLSKNGRSATVVVMYSLKLGTDKRLHGPINKKAWGSFTPRKVMLEWARRQATKRGFPPDTNKQVHIVVDGEPCLRDGLAKLFPNATFCLDIRHAEEYLWKFGRAFYPDDNINQKNREDLVDTLRAKLYEGEVENLLELLKEVRCTLSPKAKRDKAVRKAVAKAITYMQSRVDMMNYQKYIEEDLPIGSGMVEGAVRNVIGERLDCSGMRWKPERAEALLHLRCIELNGDWDHFYDWAYGQWVKRMQSEERNIQVRSSKPLELPKAA
ncbi:ISKra4 family transposase [Desulfogranum japonicum]|uniref:ISKra4 family transposase n=1 Tax=Desulfogranum japonicum TaxID=231447 RepID=UPI000404384F|nr:ISKra4 family transposase [Desulfogranum japonicum]